MKGNIPENIFRSQIEDLCRRQTQKNILLNSSFLDPAQQSTALNLSRNQGSNAFLWGGYDDAERKMLFLLPDYLERDSAIAQQNSIEALFVEVKTSGLLHKDYLGSALGTGIERRCLGDILVLEQGAILFCEKSISPYLSDNLLTVGRAKASIRSANPVEYAQAPDDGEELRINLSSLRLDALLAAGFSLSRTKVQDWIEAGYVNVNFAPCLQSGKALSAGDVISLRRFGRIKIVALDGESRKGRLFVQIIRKKSR